MKRFACLLILSLIAIAGAAYAGSASTSPRPRVKTLTDAAATGFVSVSVQSGQVVGGVIRWTIEATDGTDYQARSGQTPFSAVNKGGTVTCAVDSADGDEAVAVSAGTLTSAFTCTAGTLKATFNSNADSSLTSPTVKIKYFVEIVGPSTATGL